MRKGSRRWCTQNKGIQMQSTGAWGCSVWGGLGILKGGDRVWVAEKIQQNPCGIHRVMPPWDAATGYFDSSIRLTRYSQHSQRWHIKTKVRVIQPQVQAPCETSPESRFHGRKTAASHMEMK